MNLSVISLVRSLVHALVDLGRAPRDLDAPVVAQPAQHRAPLGGAQHRDQRERREADARVLVGIVDHHQRNA